MGKRSGADHVEAVAIWRAITENELKTNWSDHIACGECVM